MTLIFAVPRYEEVVDDVGGVCSVAGFFVSRVDTKADALIDEGLRHAPPAEADRLRELRARTEIASSKLACQRFKKLHAGERWPPWPPPGPSLWASTSAKGARYPDTFYVDNLIGPGTIDTLPEKTLAGFMDHGQVRRTLDADLDQARRHPDELARGDIDLDRVTAELETEGVESFAKSDELLLHAVTEGAAAGEASCRPQSLGAH